MPILLDFIFIPLLVFTVVFYGLLVVGFIFWIAMLFDATKRDFPTERDKTKWLLILVLLGIFGAVWYYFSVKKRPANLTDFPPSAPPSGVGGNF